MAKIKLTKNEYKQQKDSLKMYTRYLPTLQLKKQQLQLEIRTFQEKSKVVKIRQTELKEFLSKWIAVFGETSALDREELVQVKEIHTTTDNIAGVSIPVYHSIDFHDVLFNLFSEPAWLVSGVEALKDMVALDTEVLMLEESVRRLEAELRTTTQRVNLFEKLKIPETKANIKKIAIYLGDQETSAVVRGKISKKKLLEKVS